jgi:transposase
MTVRMTDAPEKVEVITPVQRRRRWSAAEKMRMVEESLEPGASVSLVARRHGVDPNQLFTWRRLAAHGAFTAAAAGEEVVPASDYRALQEQIRELHRLLGKKTLEAEILREALQHADPKKDCCCAGHWRRATVPGEGRGQDPRRGALQRRAEACTGTTPRTTARAGRTSCSRTSRRSSPRCRPMAIGACTACYAAKPRKKASHRPITNGSGGS